MRVISFGRSIARTFIRAVGGMIAHDGIGGYAMGTVSGLRTRRYHGLTITETSSRRDVLTTLPGRRSL